ncbi:Kinesin heavy chain [Phytophthora cinnamomi]|uniref:Kinesin heavy chain n=1 Tax=Phytophthora cinnamomi TaxID=4785 RepID=UPI00355A05BC|nr:Kinesin heavy chain [Phytophthora cinnamomi]
MGGEEGAASSAQFSSNSARYAERAEAGDMVRALQEELATKIKELQIYEGNYVTLKKDLARWKKKFEYVFRENELLALETGKLDASHKQIAFLQQEIKFKEEEGAALRGLVSALEAANKKQRAKQLEAARARDSEIEAAAALAAERKSSEDADAALQAERRARQEDKERFAGETAALKAENALLLKDVDRKDEELARQEEQVSAHKERIAGLEQALKDEQEAGMARLKDKQDRVLELETQVQQMEMRRRSSVAAALAQAEQEGRDMVGFGPTNRLKASHISEGDETLGSDEEPDTPPGTPPPISSGGLLPPEDPTADQTIRDWTEDRKIRAARSYDEALDLDRLDELIRKLPFEHQEGASRVLMGALDPESTDEPVNESQIVLRHLSKERQEDLREFLLPLLKAHPALKVSYCTMERRTLVTDVRIQIERRRDSVLGGFVPGEKRFGKDHIFFGPSPEDVGKLVPHMPRTISTGSKAIYVSKAKHADPVAPVPASSPLERASEHTDDMDTASETSEVPDVTASKRKWGGLNAAKFIGTMAAGAKQRVAATFKNANDREDIEVKTEWELEDDNQAPVRSVGGGVSEGDGRFLETLRIWVADQYRTTSPFVERSLLKYREGEDGEEEEDGSDTLSDGGHSHENGSQGYDEPGEPTDDPHRGIEGTSSQPGFVERNRVNSDAF